jgi:hypothetical protein
MYTLYSSIGFKGQPSRVYEEEDIDGDDDDEEEEEERVQRFVLLMLIAFHRNIWYPLLPLIALYM